MHQKRFPLLTSLAMATLAASTLVACGGGDGAQTPSGEVSPEGVYGGTRTVNGTTASVARLLVLEDGQMWAMYGINGTDGFTLQGFAHAKGTHKSGTYNATNLIDYGASNPVEQSLTATYDTSRWTWASQYGTTTLNGTELPSGLLDYHKPAMLTDVSGAWTLESYNNAGAPAEGLSLSVSATGTFTGSMSGGCPFSGKLTPRASGKNLFDTTLTFATDEVCVFKGQTVTGIAISHLLPGNAGRRQLLMGGHAVANPMVGMAAFGVRDVPTTP